MKMSKFIFVANLTLEQTHASEAGVDSGVRGCTKLDLIGKRGCKDGRGGGLGAKACLLNSLLSQSPGRCHILYTCAQASTAINKAAQRTDHDLLLISGWGLVAQGHQRADLKTAASRTARLAHSPP